MKTTTRSPEAREATATRRADVVEMRRRKMTYAAIGAELGVTAQRAYKIYLNALHDITAEQVNAHRVEQIEMATIAIDDLLGIIDKNRDKAPRTAVEAWNAIRGWTERIARVVGVDASTKVEATISAAPEAPHIVRLVEIAKEQAEAAKGQLEA